MPPSKVCPQCETIVHLRLKVCKSCQYVFRAKRKAEHNLPDKAMKRMRVLQSDSGMKAKDKLQKASKRASETSEQTVHRQERERKHMASVRASETNEQTVHRRGKDKNQKASLRATETSEQTVHRQERERKHMASVRVSETNEQTVRASETSEQTVHRREKDRNHKASTRATKNASDVSVQQQAIMSFQSDIKNGPDFVCTCCHRLMYSKSVVSAKYTKCNNDLLESVFSADLRYVCDTGNEWVCKTCDRALKRGSDAIAS